MLLFSIVLVVNTPSVDVMNPVVANWISPPDGSSWWQAHLIVVERTDPCAGGGVGGGVGGGGVPVGEQHFIPLQ
jgi:hypothetical protein